MAITVWNAPSFTPLKVTPKVVTAVVRNPKPVTVLTRKARAVTAVPRGGGGGGSVPSSGQIWPRGNKS